MDLQWIFSQMQKEVETTISHVDIVGPQRRPYDKERALLSRDEYNTMALDDRKRIGGRRSKSCAFRLSIYNKDRAVWGTQHYRLATFEVPRLPDCKGLLSWSTTFSSTHHVHDHGQRGTPGFGARALPPTFNGPKVSYSQLEFEDSV